MNALRLAAAILVVEAIASCDDSFIKGSFVDRTRVLGARVEATVEPARASIAPGERARVTWLIGAPHPPSRLYWSLATCAAPDGNFPQPRCERGALGAASGETDDALAVTELVAPSPALLGDTRALLVLAAFCEDGVTSFDPRRFDATCAKGSAVLASVTIRLAAAGANHNPEIAPGSVLFDGNPIGDSVLPCAGGDAAITAAAGVKHTFGFRFRAEDRETTNDGTEALLLSHFVNAGALERQYSALEPDAPPRDVSIGWTAPSNGATSAEVFFVLRDGRGGAAFARYVVCIASEP